MKKYLYIKCEIIDMDGAWRREYPFYTARLDGLMPIEIGACGAEEVMMTVNDEVESEDDR